MTKVIGGQGRSCWGQLCRGPGVWIPKPTDIFSPWEEAQPGGLRGSKRSWQLECIFQAEAEAVQVLVLTLVLQLRQVGSIGAGMDQKEARVSDL